MPFITKVQMAEKRVLSILLKRHEQIFVISGRHKKGAKIPSANGQTDRKIKHLFSGKEQEAKKMQIQLRFVPEYG